MADLIEAYKKQPENNGISTFIGFWGDVWTISQQFLEQTGQVQFSFVGRTGAIELKDRKISGSHIVTGSRKIALKF